MGQNLIADVVKTHRIEFMKGAHRTKFVPPRLCQSVESGHFRRVQCRKGLILRRLGLKRTF